MSNNQKSEINMVNRNNRKGIFSTITLLIVFIAAVINTDSPQISRSARTLVSISGSVRFTDSIVVTSGYVKALRIDTLSWQIVVVDSAIILPGGTYALTNVQSPVPVFIMAYPSSQDNFIPTYHPNTIFWQNAVRVDTDSNHTNIDIMVNRILSSTNNGVIYGYVNGNQVSFVSLKDAIVYAKIGSIYKGYALTKQNGYYRIPALPQGAYTLCADRIGYTGQTINANLSTDSVRVDFNLIRIPIAIKNLQGRAPDKFNLEQNFPNPFNPATRIRFEIPKSGLVKLTVFDILGKSIVTLVYQNLEPGNYEVDFNASRYPSGVYFYKMESTGYTITRKMVILK